MKHQVPASQAMPLSSFGDDRPLRLENNRWGISNNGATGTQEVWYDDQTRQFGWDWNWQGGTYNVISSYPEVIFGRKPWDRKKTLGRIDSLATLKVGFEFTTTGDGDWNASHELWLVSSSTAAPESITAEVMIWVAHGPTAQPQPAGSEVTPPGWEAAGMRLFYESHAQNNAPLLTFLYTRQVMRGEILWLEFLDRLAMLGYISKSDYIANVEFGNETINGRGSTVVERFDVEIA